MKQIYNSAHKYHRQESATGVHIATAILLFCWIAGFLI